MLYDVERETVWNSPVFHGITSEDGKLSLINVIGGDFVPPARGRLSKQPRELSDEMERGHPVWKKSIYWATGAIKISGGGHGWSGVDRGTQTRQLGMSGVSHGLDCGSQIVAHWGLGPRSPESLTTVTTSINRYYLISMN
jgi:hypothetical protein